MQTGNERNASSWDGTELDVSDPDRYQKEETYVAMLRVTVRSLRAAFPFLIIGRACQRRYLSSHIPLKSFQWVGFKVWNSGRSWIGPPVAAPVYKLCSTSYMLTALIWSFWAVSSDGRKSSWKGKNYFNITSKNRIKICLGPYLRMPNATSPFFFSLRFWFKTDTQ